MNATSSLLLAGALLAGCAGLNSVTSEVSTFGDWPVGRSPARYAFERLPSQQPGSAGAAQADQVEAAARGALAKAGFTESGTGAAADIVVQVAARSTRTEPRLWDDPVWWRGGFGPQRHGPWWPGPAWVFSSRWEHTRYEREVGLLLRDAASSRPLFEARARNDGLTRTDDTLLSAMFEAALRDFPRADPHPRRIVVALPR